MKYREIVDEIRKFTPIRVISSSSESEISKIRLWENQPVSETVSTLYFGHRIQEGVWPNHYIFASDRVDVEVEGTFADLAVIPESQFAFIFNHIQDILAERRKDDYQRYLMELADKVRSVDALVDMASETFDASLVLIDRDFRILSYSNKIPVTDKLWVDNIKKGYCDYEFITAVKNLKSVQMADPGMTPFEVTCSSSPFRKFACRVYCKDAWIGSLLLIEGNQSYRPEHVEMVRMLSSVIGYSLLAHSPELLHRTSDYQRFLYNLLIGTPIENLPKAYRDMKFSENTKLLYFGSDSVKSPPIKGMNLQDAIGRRMSDSHVITYRKGMIVVGSLKKTEDAEDLLALFPSESEISVGISNSFSGIDRMCAALSEAQDALAVGKRLAGERRVFTFEEFSVPIMLKHLSESEDINRYLHPAILALREYDEEYGAKLLPTLQEYLRHSCSIKDTAEALYLHRNSVIYRLHKAEELGGIDLNSPETKFALRMSFQILRLGAIGGES